jgi:peptide/nickel transport system ATP-binding protein
LLQPGARIVTLSARGLRKVYSGHGGPGTDVVAVADASFDLREGQTVGVVGESGSGKSTLGRLMLGLDAPTAGMVALSDVDLTTMNRTEFREFRRSVQPIFQDPRSALNWRHSIGRILAEPLVNARQPRTLRERRVREVLDEVRLPSFVLGRRPRELSGGMLQRVAIGRALVLRPRYLICDEVLSALDASVRAGIVNLLLSLQQEHQLAMLFISHDLETIRHMSDTVLVMWRGEVVESGPTSDVYEHPQHEYTRYLMDEGTDDDEVSTIDCGSAEDEL